MSAGQIFLIVVSGLGVIHGLFLAIFLWTYRRGNPLANRMLSLLLLILSYRVGKSVFLEFVDHLDVKFIFTGLGTLMAIGPLYLLYCKASISKSFRVTSAHLWHFTPAILGIAFGLWIEEQHLETLPVFLFLILFISYYSHYLIYMVISFRFMSAARSKGFNEDTFHLLRLLWLGLIVIWFAYVLNLFDELVPYIVGPVLYSIVAYVISFIVIKRGYIEQVTQTKYGTTSVSQEQMDQLYQRVLERLENENLYRDPNLTLKTLSQSLKVSTQVLSMVINQKSGVNFNSFINRYRIEESIDLLKADEYNHRTIAAIALEVGFNSLSSFNKAFKAQVGNTPQSYRQGLMK